MSLRFGGLNSRFRNDCLLLGGVLSDRHVGLFLLLLFGRLGSTFRLVLDGGEELDERIGAFGPLFLWGLGLDLLIHKTSIHLMIGQKHIQAWPHPLKEPQGQREQLHPQLEQE